MTDTTVYADIVKFARNDDGDLIVVGKATGPDMDLDQQVCDPEWLAKAMPEWFSTGGNVREQHSSIAAGVATEMSQDGDSWMVTATVVDPVSARKVEKGVLKGYSIGIKNPRVIRDKAAAGGRVISGQVVEVSLVDRPCNPSCTLTLAKSAKADADLVKVEELHEDSPIPTPKDLAERLSKAASSISSAQDLAARLGKAADTATSDEDSPEPAADPVEVVSVGDVKKEVDALETELAKPTITSSNFPPVTSSTGDAQVVFTTTTTGTEGLVKALVDEMQQRGLDKGAMPPLKPGGPPRYPISTVKDLKDAIKAMGRVKAGDRSEVISHIKSEAKRLGESALIPDNWKVLLVKDAAALNAMDDSDGWRHDPTQLRTVLSGLADCMKAELDELVAGDNELWDLTQLLSSISGFCSWWSSEAAGGETESPYTEGGSMAELAATPDATKAAEPVEPTTEAPVVEKTIEADKTDDAPKTAEPGSADLAELVKSAVAEATKGLTTAAEEREAALATELEAVKVSLAKVLALPEPGGPVITRTAAQAAVARDKDNSLLQAEVDDLLRKASQASDRSLRVGWEQRAEEIKRKIA